VGSGAHPTNSRSLDFYSSTDATEARRLLEELLEHCLKRAMPPEIQKLGRTIRTWFDKICNWHIARVTNGPTEALNNLIKHSRAREAAVTLERDVRSVRLRVADDGIGFDLGSARRVGGLGLSNIRERVDMLGGTLTIQSAPGQGTQLTIELPVADRPGELLAGTG